MASLLPLTADAVAVFNSSLQQVFIHARPMRATVIERSQLLDHPIENGQLITDYSIVLPIEIHLPVIIEAQFYRDTYQQIRNLYATKELLTVQTNTSNYQNMVIAEMPHEERPDLYDALPLTIRFRQVQEVPNPTTFVPIDPASTDTQALGQQNNYPITTVTTQSATPVTPVGTVQYSSVPTFSTGVVSGIPTTGISPNALQATPENIPVTGAQTLTSTQSIGSAFSGAGGF